MSFEEGATSAAMGSFSFQYNGGRTLHFGYMHANLSVEWSKLGDLGKICIIFLIFFFSVVPISRTINIFL